MLRTKTVQLYGANDFLPLEPQRLIIGGKFWDIQAMPGFLQGIQISGSREVRKC